LIDHHNNRGTVSVFDLLEQLIEYANNHFETEEAILKRYKSPDLEIQKNDHLDFSLQMTVFYKEAMANKQSLPDKLLSFLTLWWVD